ncbi:MAG: hypothetical protein AAF633_23665 [Chloroflexota bacterium]
MKITRDVIIDLLPLYLSGEASPDTQSLVQAFFKQDPDFEKLAMAKDVGSDIWMDIEKDQPMEENMNAFLLIKRILNFRASILGIALFLSFLPLSMAGSSEQGIYWIMIRDQPVLALAFGLGALVAWGVYIWTFLSLRSS